MGVLLLILEPERPRRRLILHQLPCQGAGSTLPIALVDVWPLGADQVALSIRPDLPTFLRVSQGRCRANFGWHSCLLSRRQLVPTRGTFH
jgi:hypothetical protein